MTMLKEGTVVRVVAPDAEYVHRNGKVGVIEKFNTIVDGYNCYMVKFSKGDRGSYSEQWLEPVPDSTGEKITLEQVVAAKNVVDKAQKMFVELLSKYQLQEASK